MEDEKLERELDYIRNWEPNIYKVIQAVKKKLKGEVKQFLIDYEEETGNPLWMGLNKWCDEE